MKNPFKSLFTLAFILMSVVFSVSIAQAKGKEPQPFTKDTVFMTKNVVMYAQRDTLKLMTKKLTKIEIKNGIISANGMVLTNGKAVKLGARIKVSWINPSGTIVVYTGNNARKVKSSTAKTKQKTDKQEKEASQMEAVLLK